MKNSMSTLDIYVWIEKWGKSIEKCFVDNIYSLENNILVFKLNCKGKAENPMILIEASKRIHLTKHVIVGKSKHTPLIQAMRKRLRNAILESIEQLGWERIVKLVFKKHSETYFVYLEIIPRGVIVLTDSENTIIYASKFVKMKDRSIVPKGKYSLPPAKGMNPLAEPIEKLYNVFSGEKNVSKGFIKCFGVPSEIINEILFRLNMGKDKDKWSFKDFLKAYSVFKEIIDESMEGKGYIVKTDKGNYVTVTPFKPKHIEKHVVEEYSDFNEALDEYFTEVLKQARMMEMIKAKHDEVTRLEKSIEEALKVKEKYAEEAEICRRMGDLIMHYMNDVALIINCLRSKNIRKLEPNDAVKACNKVSRKLRILEYLKDKGKVVVEADNVKIPIDIRLSPYENAAKYYEKAKERKRKASKVDEKVFELKMKLKRLLEEEAFTVEEEKARIKRREWFEKYHWTISKDGYLILGGRDASQNESLVRKLLEPNDIFMHADIHGASAVIIKSKGKASEEALKEAAVIAASYSKAWKEGLASIDVYWVWGDQVSKKPPAGEYLTKGAFMIYGKKNYIRNVPLELALGLQVINDSLRVIVGSEQNVKEKAIAYVILSPGSEEPYKLAKRIKKIFYEKLPESFRAKVKVVSEEEIAREIPGLSTIRKVVILLSS